MTTVPCAGTALGVSLLLSEESVENAMSLSVSLYVQCSVDVARK